MNKIRQHKHICPDCLSAYKRSSTGILERKKLKQGMNANWGKHKWPEFIYNYEKTRKCNYHNSLSLFYSSKRRAVQLNTFPQWADKEAIKEIYKNRIKKELQTGKKYHVDHIVPLQGKRVCGFHVEYNLQILPAHENIKKNNKF